MSREVKIVINLKEEKALVGIGSPNCDPCLTTLDGGLEQALARIPELLQQAEQRWSESPLNPKATIVTTPPPSPPAVSTVTSSKSDAKSDPARPTLF